MKPDNMIQGKSALDIALEVAMGILKDASGYNDIRDCLGGDWGACAVLALDAALPFAGRAKRILKALDRSWDAFNSWSHKLALARDIPRRVERYQQAMAEYAEDLAEWKRQIEEAAERARKLEEEAAAARRRVQEAAAAAAKKADEAEATAAKQGKSSATKAKKADGDGKASKSAEAKKGDAPKKSKAKEADSGGSEKGETCNSFVPGTEVLPADGSSKPIEDIALGDEVVATDPESGAATAQPVVTQIIGEGEKKLVEITIDTDGENGDASEKLTATDGHPFWAPSLDRWLQATDLTAGDWLRTSSGTWVQVTEVKRRDQYQKVRNLTVAREHTYYVLAGASPILVHNGDHVALGRDSKEANVKEFAEAIGARHLMGALSSEWRDEVHKAIANVASGEGKISFLLDGLDGGKQGPAAAPKKASMRLAHRVAPRTHNQPNPTSSTIGNSA
ncbi:polymorphic toxin-type HINT domain-containing protein [Streptomyces sp. NPDC049949]|uniref:polymorphic toxin-type HINT domain-containing protein n=1 Tax=Streptomyces sp. NPDC049949 TaxID=3154627 RepID=UPI00341DFB01